MNLAFIGHSHVGAVLLASRKFGGSLGATVKVAQLRSPAFMNANLRRATSKFDGCNQDLVEQAVAEATEGASLAILYPCGNEHNMLSLTNRYENREDELLEKLNRSMDNYRRWLDALSRYVRSPAAMLPPPPPIESESHIRENPSILAEEIARYGVAPAEIRLRVWLQQLRLMREVAATRGLRLLELPQEIFSEHGFLHNRFMSKSPTHANAAYGALIIRRVANFAATLEPASTVQRPASYVPGWDGSRQHPYAGLPDRAFWKQAVAQVPIPQFDPAGGASFRILRSDRVATAGSCFAQHISKRIRSAGFQFLMAERPQGDAAGVDEAGGFYDFSARYGNIYTARQLVQLFDRAFGYFTPLESHWRLRGDRFCDPFRPGIEPDGFPSVEALVQDRRRHLAAVREMFVQLDVLVFTLGLTECWISRLDGAAYPVAPGVAGGEFDSSKYEFTNFGVDDVFSDLQSFVRKLRLVNPKARILLTVSPVPLVATYEPCHVLVSTTYSKSVLRVAADMLSRSCEGVCYFPSFEIVTGNYNRGRYFGPDLRSVTKEGVDHVMSVFMRHLTESGETPFPSIDAAAGSPESNDDVDQWVAVVEAACDEEMLEQK